MSHTPDVALVPYLSTHHLEWLAVGGPRWRVTDGSILFLDVSGFTPLTERLATRGKVGAEELTDHLNAVFGTLIAVSDALGGDVLKFGGDALLLLFSGTGHEARAVAAAWDMQLAMREFSRLRTSVGTVPLRASCGVASGPVNLFLAGGAFDEQVAAGPTVTACLELEKAAEATEVLVAASTADVVGAGCFEDGRDGGRLLVGRPVPGPPPPARTGPPADPRRGLPRSLADELGHLSAGEHRHGVVMFCQVRGFDDLLREEGAHVAASHLDALLADVQAACDRHDVTFLTTDADLGAIKVMLAAGAPRTREDDADRALRAAREIVGKDRRLAVRIGVNRGRVFALDLGAASRRTYTTMGDATNLAARVMGKAPERGVLATDATLACVRGAFALEPVTPFAVKGKTALVEGAVVGDPVDADDPVHARTAAADATPPPGREHEATLVRSLIEDAAIGLGGALELRGEAGIGKSRLVDVALAVARDAGCSIVLVEGGAYGAHAPYLALRAPLRRLLGVPVSAPPEELEAGLRRAARAHVADADDWVPLLGPLVGLDLAPSDRIARLDAEAVRRRRHLVAAELLGGLLPAARTLLLIEDSHWLDGASADLLAAVLAMPSASRWAILTARRPSEDGLRLPELDRVRIVDVAPLPAATARALLLEAVAAEGGLPPDAVPVLVDRAGGNPFVLRELVHAVRAGGDIDTLPENVEDLLAASIDRLPPPDRAALRHAAVLGTRFPRGALAAMLEVDDAEVPPLLDRLATFVVQEGDQIRFRHALQRTAAYEALAFRRRRELHGRAADVVAAGADREAVVELLALHTHHAGRHADCWRWARRGAERAVARGAPTDALALFDWAIDAGRRLKDVDARALAEVHEARGDAAELAGRYELAAAAYRAARRGRRDDPVRVADLYCKSARMCERRGSYRQALACATRGRRVLHAVPRDARRSAVEGRLADVAGSARLRQGRAQDAATELAVAMELLERAGDRRALAHASYILAGAHVALGRTELADDLSRKALRLYEEVGDLSGVATVLNNMAVDAYWVGRWDESAELLERSRRTRQELGDVVLTAESDLNLGELLSDQGRLDEAERLLRDAAAVFRAAPRPEGLGLAVSDLGRLAARRGDTEEALRLLAEARDLLERIGAEGLALEAAVREAECLALAGRPEAALAAVERTAEHAHKVAEGRHYLANLERSAGYAAAQAGDAETAWGRFERSLSLAREHESLYEEATTLLALARLSAARGTPDPAVEARARQALEDLGVVTLAEPPLEAR